MEKPILQPAQPLSFEERLMKLIYGEPGLEHMAMGTLQRQDEMAEEEPVTSLSSPIPGANPEVPTGADALVGALMSMGGVPPTIARSGRLDVPRPGGIRHKPARTDSLKSVEHETGSVTDSILRVLSQRGADKTQLANELGVPVGEVERSITKLRNSGMIHGKKYRGTESVYTLSVEGRAASLNALPSKLE